MLGSLIPWRTRYPVTYGRFERDMEKLMERFFEPEEAWFVPAEFAPRVNIAETEKGYEVSMDLPGVSPKELTVEVRDNSLVVSGERKEEKEEKGKTFHRVERRFGKFSRMVPFELPVEREKVEANYQEGVLRITVPKLAGAVAKRIEVTT